MHVWGHACAYTDLMIAAPVLKLSQLYCLSLPLPWGSQKLTVKATAGGQAVMVMAEDHTACAVAAALTDGKAEAAVLAKVGMRLEMQVPETVAVVMEAAMIEAAMAVSGAAEAVAAAPLAHIYVCVHAHMHIYVQCVNMPTHACMHVYACAGTCTYAWTHTLVCL